MAGFTERLTVFNYVFMKNIVSRQLKQHFHRFSSSLKKKKWGKEKGNTKTFSTPSSHQPQSDANEVFCIKAFQGHYVLQIILFNVICTWQ